MKLKNCVLKTIESCEELQKNYNVKIEDTQLKAGQFRQHFIKNTCYLIKLYNRDNEDYQSIEKRYNSPKDCTHSLFTPFEENGEWYEEVVFKDDIILTFFEGVFQVEETHGYFFSYDIDEVFKIMNLILPQPIDSNKLEIIEKNNAF